MMLKVVSEFSPARESISWAEDAIEELNAAVDRFFQGDVTEVITEIDPQTGENVQKVRLRQALPGQMARKATEALTNARHAFDQATYAARILTSGRSRKTVYFPWSQNPRDLNHLLKSRGIDERLWDTFRAHQPYPRSEGHTGGDDVIRALATLANQKHTVGLSVAGHIAMTAFPSIYGNAVQSLNVLMPRWDPMKNEADLIRWRGDVQVNGDYHFSFEIVFQDARLSHPVNAVAGLAAFAGKAKAVVKSLEARCLEVCG